MCATVWKSLLRGYCPANAHRELRDDACLKYGRLLQVDDVSLFL